MVRVIEALLPLVLPGSHMLHELHGDTTDSGQQKGVDEAALVHHKLQHKPNDEKR